MMMEDLSHVWPEEEFFILNWMHKVQPNLLIDFYEIENRDPNTTLYVAGVRRERVVFHHFVAPQHPQPDHSAVAIVVLVV